MSVTFTIADSIVDFDDPTTYLNVTTIHAADILRWLDIECAAALEAVGLAEEERGHLRRSETG